MASREENIAKARSEYHNHLGAKEDTIKENMKLREKRDAAAQIAELDRRLGKGVGAVKERAKLAKMIG